jgi:hypothetical protein
VEPGSDAAAAAVLQAAAAAVAGQCGPAVGRVEVGVPLCLGGEVVCTILYVRYEPAQLVNGNSCTVQGP